MTNKHRTKYEMLNRTDTMQKIISYYQKGDIRRDIAADLIHTLKQPEHSKKNDKIAIIGIALRLPGANSPEVFFNNICKGLSHIGQYPVSRQLDSSMFRQLMGNYDVDYRTGGYIEDIDKFDYQFFNMSPMQACLTDPCQRIMLQVAWEAMEDAGYTKEMLTGSRTGVYIGYSGASLYGLYLNKYYPELQAISIIGNASPYISGKISYTLNLKGPSMLVDTACSSSLAALHLACNAIQEDECDQAFIGGIKIDLFPLNVPEANGIESSNRIVRPFDDNADGTVWGEGSVAIFVKRLEDAIRDRDNIYAVIMSCSLNNGGQTAGMTAPNSDSQSNVMLRAWEKAGIHPESLSYIESHGTGTKLGDMVEIEGITKAFAKYTNKKQFCALGTLKPNIGHSDTVSGIAGFVKAVMTLKMGKLPPNILFKHPNRLINYTSSPVYLNDSLQNYKEELKICGVNSFGISGTNAHVVLAQAPVLPYMEMNSELDVHIMSLSSKTITGLLYLLKEYVLFLSVLQVPFRDVCYTQNVGRGHYQYRIAIITNNRDDLVNKMNALLETAFSTVEFPGMVYLSQNLLSDKMVTNSDIKKVDGLPNEYYGDENRKVQELQHFCTLYVRGQNVQWDKLYKDDKRYRVSVPGYPFLPQRHWLDRVEATYGTCFDSEVADDETYVKDRNDKKLCGWKNEIHPSGREDGKYTEYEILLTNIITKYLGYSSLDINCDLFEYGLNSLVSVKIINDINKAVKIKLEPLDIIRFASIQRVAKHMERISMTRKNDGRT